MGRIFVLAHQNLLLMCGIYFRNHSILFLSLSFSLSLSLAFVGLLVREFIEY